MYIKKEQIPQNNESLVTAIKSFEERLAVVKAMDPEDLGDALSGLDPAKSRYPLNRAERILSIVRQIAARLSDENKDDLDVNDVMNLISILNYSKLILLEPYPAQRGGSKVFTNPDFAKLIGEYKDAGNAIAKKNGNHFQKLSGHVLQTVGALLVLSLALTLCNPALLLPLGIIAAVGAVCVGVGTYLAKNNSYRALNSEVYTTLHSPACDKTITADPEEDSYIKSMVSNFFR